MPPSRQRQRIHHPVPFEQRPRHPFQLGVDEAEIEGRVMHHQDRALDEGEHVVGELGEARLVEQELGGEPVHLEGLVGNIALGVQMAMPNPPRRDAIDQLDAADLDDAMAVERVEPRRFRIEHDFAQKASPLSPSLLPPSYSIFSLYAVAVAP